MFLIASRSVAPPSAAALEAHRRGVVLASQGQYEAALEAFRTAVFLSPDYAEGHRCIGLMLQEMALEDEALAAYQEAVRLDPEFVFVWLNLAEILNVLGRNDEALGSYGEALRLRPELRDETQSLRNWLINAPRHKVNPNERLQIDSVSVLPPAGDHWVIEEAAARISSSSETMSARAVGTQWSRRQSSPPLSLAVAAFQLWSTSYNARGGR